MFEEQSMINRLSNPINRNRSAAKISKVMSSNIYTLKGTVTGIRPDSLALGLFLCKRPLWLSLALTTTLWHTLALSGSLLLSNLGIQ